RVAGLDVLDPAQRRRLPSQLGVVFQNPEDQLFSATVLDDVAFGPLNLGLPPAEARARAEEALARVGLAGYEGRGAVPPLGGGCRSTFRAARSGGWRWRGCWRCARGCCSWTSRRCTWTRAGGGG